MGYLSVSSIGSPKRLGALLRVEHDLEEIPRLATAPPKERAKTPRLCFLDAQSANRLSIGLKESEFPLEVGFHAGVHADYAIRQSPF
mgnify:CR=1 FL=1